ncbi:MAG TPA: subclass B3 metallo-beta-lactamase [Polyangia bacterium]|nr:subclass B3 metallo-beta-lactamase [Polyangia bacterium]
MNRRAPAAILLLALGAGCASQPGVPREMRAWNREYPPFNVIANIYYVGSSGIAQFLVTTPDGHFLIDSGFEVSVPRLRANIESLGFRFADVKFLLTSHAHIDHVQGHARVRSATGATVVASAADGRVVASGGKGEAVYDGVYSWTPCPVDRTVADGDAITLGGTTLVAHLTPGHTMGATTWTMRVVTGGRSLDVVFFPSANINPGVRLVGNARYPNIAEDFARSFATWRALPCDVFLGVHGSFFDLDAKRARMGARGPNPFIDPDGYRNFIAEAEQRFRAQLASEH